MPSLPTLARAARTFAADSGSSGACVRESSGRFTPEACTLRWQESLTLLAQLVEEEIPGSRGRSPVEAPPTQARVIAVGPSHIERQAANHCPGPDTDRVRSQMSPSVTRREK
jgi:hypothetical protein